MFKKIVPYSLGGDQIGLGRWIQVKLDWVHKRNDVAKRVCIYYRDIDITEPYTACICLSYTPSSIIYHASSLSSICESIQATHLIAERHCCHGGAES